MNSTALVDISEANSKYSKELLFDSADVISLISSFSSNVVILNLTIGMMVDRLEGLTNFSNNKKRIDFDDIEFIKMFMDLCRSIV
jgi:hypothetical protein